MKRILISLSIIGIVAAIAIGGTIAYFSDVETSAGNTFTAGKLDLKIDNVSYYNGQMSSANTWGFSDLPVLGKLFFSFSDVKPGDWGEDTVSLRVINNPAWACVDFSLTKNDDVSSKDPELEAGDIEEDPQNLFDGELAQELNFIWWADDGDNVLEENEVPKIFLSGSMYHIFGDGTVSRSYALADATKNIWTGVAGEPLTTTQPYFIGKAWCLGRLDLAPVETGFGLNPVMDPGIRCDGISGTNLSQSDLIEATLSFQVVQSRNNPNFRCNPAPPGHGGGGGQL